MDETKPENPQAFPTLGSTNAIDERGREQPAHRHYSVPGMTLRDYFAAKAVPEAMRQCAAFNDHPSAKRLGLNVDCATAAGLAYEMADAMLKARAK